MSRRIDEAIAQCEKIDFDVRCGCYPSHAEYVVARDAAEREYRDAMSEMLIRTTKERLAATRTVH